MNSAQVLSSIALIFVAGLVLASARSTHFGDNTEAQETEALNSYDPSLLANIEMELLAQRLARLNKPAFQYPNTWDRMEPAEVKRAAKNMRCYFNPVSCYKK